jgi:probable F420-dependent oxidoreductase
MIAFGATLITGPRWWVSMAQTIEAAGFESLWVPEHLVMPVTMAGAPNTPHEGEPPISAATPAYDPWVQIATMAASTSTLRFGTNVYNIGLRHPIITARALTTVDAISGGRIDFGIGASWLAQEWRVMELDFEARGRRIDESIEVIQRLFTEDEIEHDGACYRFPPVGFLPKPVQDPWPPMLIGGDSAAAMRRAARVGDGWIPMAQTLETLPDNLRRIEQLRSDLGRSGSFQVAVIAQVHSVDEVRRYEDAGATRLIIAPFENPREAADGYRRFGDEIIAKV